MIVVLASIVELIAVRGFDTTEVGISVLRSARFARITAIFNNLLTFSFFFLSFFFLFRSSFVLLSFCFFFCLF